MRLRITSSAKELSMGKRNVVLVGWLHLIVQEIIRIIRQTSLVNSFQFLFPLFCYQHVLTLNCYCGINIAKKCSIEIYNFQRSGQGMVKFKCERICMG